MLTKNSASDKPKWEDALSTNWRSRAKQAVLTVGECEDALRDVFLAAQEKSKKLSTKIPATVLHGDVRRIIVLLPVEEGKT